MAKLSPQETAKREIEKLIVTKEMAKEKFIKWIDDTDVAYGYHSEEVKTFWKETREETLKL